MSTKEENLDDIIASLIDFEEEETSTEIKEERELTGEPVRLTERAAKQVKKIKASEESHENLYLRVAVEGGGCSGLSYKLGLDHRTDADVVFENFGVEVIVNSDHLLYLIRRFLLSNQSYSSFKCDIMPAPFGKNPESISEANKEKHVNYTPHDPSKKTSYFKTSNISNSLSASNRCHGSFV